MFAKEFGLEITLIKRHMLKITLLKWISKHQRTYLSFFPWFHLLTYLITYVVGFEFDSWVHLITYLSFPFTLWKSVCIVIVAPLPFNYSQLPRKIWLTHSYYTLSSSTKNFFFMWVSSTKNTHELHTCRL